MTIPLLLVALYFGALVLSLALSSWVGLSAAPPDEVRRVSDAVERAALSQLSRPAAWGLGLIVLLCSGGALLASRQDGALLFHGLAPLITAFLGTAALYYAARRVHRVTGQVATLPGPHQGVALVSRSVLAAVLLTGAATGLLLLGQHLLVATSHGPQEARRVSLLSCGALAIVALVMGRVAAVSSRGSSAASEHAPPAPHAASLALLVSHSFHAPLLRLSFWMVGAALGHAALILATPELDAPVWLYPHLLVLIGLFSLTFAGLVVRATPDEPLVHGWLRGGAVFLVLLIAGSWSMAWGLPSQLARFVPAGLTFFFLLFAVLVGTSPGSPAGPQWRAFPLGASLARVLSSSLVTVLVLTLLLLSSTAKGEGLSAPVLNRLIVAGTVAMLPLMVSWSLAIGVESCREQTARLAFVQEAIPAQGVRGMQRLLGGGSIVGFFLAAGTLTASLTLPEPSSLLPLATGFALGALFAAASAGLAEEGMERIRRQVGAQFEQSSTANAASLNLEQAVSTCSAAVAHRAPLWLFSSLLPALAVVPLRLWAPEALALWTSTGIAFGVVLIGSAHSWLTAQSDNQADRVAGLSSLTSALGQVLLILLFLSQFPLSPNP